MSTEDQQIEKLAIVIYEASNGHKWPLVWGWETMPEGRREMYRVQARAAMVYLGVIKEQSA